MIATIIWIINVQCHPCHASVTIFQYFLLGIRARVVAIYEPPQESTRDSVTLYPDSKAEDLKILAQQLGLTAVGWIFTDLIAEDASKVK